jgi:glycosyltransferase involved in cell wall biosynthesis
VPVEQGWGSGKIVQELFEKLVEGTIEQPTFVCDFPREVSPLARPHRDDPGLTEHFDLVHADSLDLSYYFPLLEGIPLACTHHDAQSALLARRASFEPSVPRRAYFNRQASLRRKEEGLWCPRVALNVAVSEVDAGKLADIAPSSRFLVVPNGVDTSYFQPEMRSKRHGIVSVGGTTWYPNKDSLQYFATTILPLLRAKGLTEPVTWVGRASAEEVDKYRREFGITMTGYVDDVRPYVQSAACYIVPIRMGGGTRVKILDAWAMGVPIVSTAIGCEGLAAVDGQNILVRDDPELFADSVWGLLANTELGTRLGTAGRATAELHYSWDALGRY